MKIRLFIMFSCVIFLTRCGEKQHHFEKNQLKQALIICLDDHDLKGRMFTDSLTRVNKHWYLYGNMLVSDSLKIGYRLYSFNSKVGYIPSDSTIAYKLTYKSKNAASIHIAYQPGINYKIIGDYDFKFDGNEWKLEKRVNGIVDGKF